MNKGTALLAEVEFYLLCKRLSCRVTNVRSSHAEGTFVLICKVTIVNMQRFRRIVTHQRDGGQGDNSERLGRMPMTAGSARPSMEMQY